MMSGGRKTHRPMHRSADRVALLDITDQVHAYMVAKYQQSLGLQVVQPPQNWTSDMIADCNHAVAVIVEAKNNRCKPTYTSG
jgi:hypothetical protein